LRGPYFTSIIISMSKRIMLVGGGSGGHVFPLIAVAESLRQKDPSLELIALGEGSFMAQAIAGTGITYHAIFAGKMRRYFSVWSFLDPFKAIVGLFQSLWWLLYYMPDVVFCKGGYVSVMPALVAKLYFIPVYIHESDSIPGMANKLIGKMAKTVFISFENAAKYFNPATAGGKTILVGNPVRPELLIGQREPALAAFNFRADKKTILIAGGSQGSKRINEAILESLVQLVQQFQVIHQCGDSQMASVQAEVDKFKKEGETSYGSMINANYRLYPFLPAEQLAMAYAAADVIISRGGASNLFEIAALGKPAIIIPITNSASDHQMQNTVEFARYGGVLIEEANVTSHIIINQIQELLEPAHYPEISAKIKTFAKPEAANMIADALLAN
jgi:UDP-N-acetylglucosamine--N-acetylmuramyl-(pentapeptide) pyrophosphoryl-undecaprenol N-acetylglucosamine transferase